MVEDDELTINVKAISKCGYVGRMDNQIKLNGQRIELGEIERVISEISSVEAVAVMIKQNNNQDVLVAFYCGDESSINEITISYSLGN